ncbi:hypothetical protein [Bacillus sp. J33]|uniref:hypothetical protein n=1 Tax=Bacillus sp. J33 TaxID=935836 RepID=UPI0004B213E4|nr:hypothetical protein [Bacillus sp. J33]
MNFLKSLFNEKCPACHKVLRTDQSNTLFSVVVKTCPNNHFKKEYHPALEMYIESKMHC